MTLCGESSEANTNSNGQAYYALFVFTILTALNQLHRYLLIAAIEPMSNDLQFGDRNCTPFNGTSAIDSYIQEYDLNTTAGDYCMHDDGIRCTNETTFQNTTLCEWHYTGTGSEYEILAGPVFIIVLGILGVPITVLAEMGRINRRNVVGVCTICWSLTIVCTGFSQTLAEVYVWRFLLGFFEAPFNPFSMTLLVTFFGPRRRGLAMGVAASGAYLGYGSSYAFIAVVNVIGWRWTYISTGIGGALLGLISLITVKNPYSKEKGNIPLGSVRNILKALGAEPWSVLSPIFLAFACKMGYQYTLSYNLNNYFVEYFPTFPTDVYLSWILALTGILAFMLGGFLSDIAGKRAGALGRLWTIVILEVIQIPLYVFFILLSLPTNIILGALGITVGDGWNGIGLSAIADIVSPSIRTVIYALFFCVMDVIGGCVIVAVTPLTDVAGLKSALLWLGTGMLVGGTLLILCGIIALVLLNRRRARSYHLEGTEEDALYSRNGSQGNHERTPLISDESTPT
ncbi:high-affinity nitrate transporter 2.1 [Strongylocentrotus purpuratus]|uniref:Major facilitator superfamily (MFS) profile domain-containing protein n=1 Tax=Strongylocentrotus purpuratus TaxID=7668 RepID=A0A7M7NMS3_STRPU|nr:high-affinity nitrate transporter 2.1 [Strongylocentrotus purpuratus]